MNQQMQETAHPKDQREELVQAINELYQVQLITSTGGNLSVRIPGRDEAWITPSRLYKGNLVPDVMVRIDLNGNPLDKNSLSPSSERLVHTQIYKARPDVQAVIHTHAPQSTILGLSRRPFLPVTVDAALIKELPLVPFYMPGSAELAQAVAFALSTHTACIMQNHGLVVVANNLRRAINLTEAVERNCQLILGSFDAGSVPQTLPDHVVEMIHEVEDVVKMMQESGELLD
jgi:autoinducer 2 (AI-2) kinase